MTAATEITLSKLVGPKPIVLVFGNFTCGPFRSQAGNIEKLYRRYHDRATFVMVYVREAHPTGGWQLDSNNRLGVAIPQPQSNDERVKVAQMCSSRLGLGMPMLVDTIDDAVGARYSGMPSRLYLLDHRGRVAFKNGRGPFGFKPAELEHALILLLQDEFPDLKGKDSAAANSSVKPKGDPAVGRLVPYQQQRVRSPRFVFPDWKQERLCKRIHGTRLGQYEYRGRARAHETAGPGDGDGLGCGRSDRRGDLPDSGRAWRSRWARRSGCWPSG